VKELIDDEEKEKYAYFTKIAGKPDLNRKFRLIKHELLEPYQEYMREVKEEN
jgi:hypothetical protein